MTKLYFKFEVFHKACLRRVKISYYNMRVKPRSIFTAPIQTETMYHN